MDKRARLILILAFTATRLLGVFLAANPQVYGTSYAQVTSDPILYGSWASAIVREHRVPYAAVRIEYPPAVLPFAVAPEVLRAPRDDYAVRFVLVMLAVDVAAFVGIMRLARRWGSTTGPWIWVFGVILLGPISWARLDLIPALATIWALERAAAGSWFGAGGWLSFGTLAKVYPAFLAPLLLLASERKGRVVAGFALVSVLLLLPHLGALGPLTDSVFGFHSARGIHVESSWGALLLGADALGYDTRVELSYGSFNVVSGATGVFKALANAGAVAILIAGTMLARRVHGDAARLAALMYATLGLVMVTGTVFSPQFLLWLLALGAVAACRPSATLRAPLLTLYPIAGITQIIYPYVYELLLAGNGSALAVLASRNVLVAVSAVGVLGALRAETGISGPVDVEAGRPAVTAAT